MQTDIELKRPTRKMKEITMEVKEVSKVIKKTDDGRGLFEGNVILETPQEYKDMEVYMGGFPDSKNSKIVLTTNDFDLHDAFSVGSEMEITIRDIDY